MHLPWDCWGLAWDLVHQEWQGLVQCIIPSRSVRVYVLGSKGEGRGHTAMGKGVWVVWVGVEVEGWTAGVVTVTGWVTKVAPPAVLEVGIAVVRRMGK